MVNITEIINNIYYSIIDFFSLMNDESTKILNIYGGYGRYNHLSSDKYQYQYQDKDQDERELGV